MPVEFIRITAGKMVSVRIIDDTRLFGRHFPTGTVVNEVPEQEAHELVMARKAVFYTAPEPEEDQEPEGDPEPCPVRAARR